LAQTIYSEVIFIVIFAVSSIVRTTLCEERKKYLVINTENNSSLQADSCSDSTDKSDPF